MMKFRNKKKKDSKIHFIIFQTAKKPVNVSISKIAVSVFSVFFVVIFSCSVLYSFHVNNVNTNLSGNVVELKDEVVGLKDSNEEIDKENLNLKNTLEEKSFQIETKLNELEELQKTVEDLIGSNATVENNNVQVASSRGLTVGGRSDNEIPKSGNESTYKKIDKFNEQIESLTTKLEVTKEDLSVLKDEMDKKIQYLASMPTLFPTNGQITSRFGGRWGDLHRGVDIANQTGTEIYAAAAGTVTEARYDASYGNYVLIDHGNGFVTRYAHMSKRLIDAGE